MKKNNSGVMSNLIWKFAERITAQLITLVVSVILARLLDPEHYGVIAIVTIFITIANVFVSDGFGSALVQKRNADIIDFSSVLYFNIIFSSILYIILFFLAPLISKFYGAGYEILTPVTRVLGLRLILSGINSVQQAYISRHMMFRMFFWSTLFGTLISGIVGVGMAYSGFGIWALVAQYLTNTTVDTIVLQIVLNKWPKKVFSWSRLRVLISYGYKILFTSLTITGYQELRTLIIGKLYSSNDLAYYDKGKQFPNLVVTNINSSIGAVLFPKMAQEQDNRERVKTITRTSVRFSSYIMSPIMLGLIAIAEPFVKIILTDKWLPCVPLLQLFCLFYMFQPIQTANTQSIKALGRSDIALKMEIIRDVIQLVVLLVVMWISVDAIVISMAILSFIFVFVNGYPNIKLIGYTYKEQVSDFIAPLIMSFIMSIVVLGIGKIECGVLIKMGIQIVIGCIIYVLLSILSKNKEFASLVMMIQKR